MTYMETQNAAQNSEKKGRKRAILAVGVLLGIGALITTAAFTDNAFLSLNGAGFGGATETFNIEVSNGNESDATAVGTWQECDDAATPCAITISAGTIVLNPDVSTSTQVVNMPVKNATTNMAASMSLGLIADLTMDTSGLTGADLTAQQAKNQAYLDAMVFDIAVDGTTVATNQRYAALADAGTPYAFASNWAATTAKVVTLTIRLDTSGTTVTPSDLNGGGLTMTAAFHATSV